MRLYECTILLRPELSKVQVEEAQNELVSILTETGGETSGHEYWGFRSLAYPIEKMTRAHYIYFNAKADPKAVIEMERQMRIREDVIRYLNVRVEAHSEEPTAVMQSKYRDETKDTKPRSKRPSSDDKAA